MTKPGVVRAGVPSATQVEISLEGTSLDDSSLDTCVSNSSIGQAQCKQQPGFTERETTAPTTTGCKRPRSKLAKSQFDVNESSGKVSKSSGARVSCVRQSVHPCGVQPLGNRWQSLSQGSGDDAFCRERGLGFFRALSDDKVVDFLELLPESDLRNVSCCSRALYAFSFHQELWKRLVLTEFGGDFLFAGGSWKHTLRKRKYGCSSPEPSGASSGSSPSPPKRFPVQAPGLYSDFLYQPYFYRSLGVSEQWLAVDNVDRVCAAELTVQKFVELYEKPNRPVVITGVADKWPAFGKWTKEYLLKQAQSTTQTFSVGGFPMTMAGYFAYAEGNQDDQPLYLFDKKFVETEPSFGQDYEVPKYFKEDLFSLLGAERPDYRWLIIGPAGSGSHFHQDPNSTSAWNAVLSGRKKWVMYPPTVRNPPGVHPSADGLDVATPLCLAEWFHNFYKPSKRRRRMRADPAATKPRHGNSACGARTRAEQDGDGLHSGEAMIQMPTAAGGEQERGEIEGTPTRATGGLKSGCSEQLGRGESSEPEEDLYIPDPYAEDDHQAVEFVAEPGDVVFVPRRWWHAVLNIEDSVAITQNLVPPSSASRVLRFLIKKKHLISGYQDTEMRETLGERLIEKLREHRPDIEIPPNACTDSVSTWEEIKKDRNTEAGSFSFGFQF